jgi:hypothetical protein
MRQHPSATPAATNQMNWHRQFGLLLSDFFTGSPFVVELEKDLSLKKQLLDVVSSPKARDISRRRHPSNRYFSNA